MNNKPICVLTGCLPNYNELAAITIYDNKAKYCARFGYALEVFTKILPQYDNRASHANGYSWSRLARMLELVKSGEFSWVYCVGCDTMITNFWIGLEDIIRQCGTPNPKLPDAKFRLPPGAPGPVVTTWKKPTYQPDGQTHIIFACDRASLVQADSFLIRASEVGCSYLQDILDQYPIYCTQPWVEQQAMSDLRHKHGEVMRIVPQCWLNSYNYRLFDHLGPYYKEGKDCYGNRGEWVAGDFLIHWPSTSLEMRLALSKVYQNGVVD